MNPAADPLSRRECVPRYKIQSELVNETALIVHAHSYPCRAFCSHFYTTNDVLTLSSRVWLIFAKLFSL